MENPVLRVKQGELRGKQYKTINGADFYGFLGIPYAAAPIGDLRFKPPLPPTSWAGTRDATQEGNMCIQVDVDNPGSVIGEEDCLLLNVYTPILKTDTKLPVMVFIHGGGFICGSKETTGNGPHFLIEQGVVVVNINYRLGIFGFLNLGLPGAQGNMGLKDQVQALKWVQENVSQFSGDPSNVTIFGISAGGVSVELLCLSRTADGLYHKAIAQSGSSLNNWAKGKDIQQLAFSIAKNQAKEVHNTIELLDYLKQIPASKLALLALSVIQPNSRNGGIAFEYVPTLEKVFPGQEAFISQNTLELLTCGDFNKVPFMSGFCRREGLLVNGKTPENVDRLLSDKDFLYFLPFSLDKNETELFKNRAKKIYLDTIKPDDEEDNFVIDFFTDVDFLGGIYTATRLMAQHNSPIYFYELAYDGKLNYLKTYFGMQRKGTCHGDDGGYLFFNEILPTDCSDEDKLVRDRMVKMWTNFAKFGNPTPQINQLLPTTWKPLTRNYFDYLIIDDKLTMSHDPAPDRTALFEDLYLNVKSDLNF